MNDFSLNGPVPTGFSLRSVVGSLMSFQMCSGTIAWLASTAGSCMKDFDLKVSTAVSSDVAFAVAARPDGFSAGVFETRLNVNATSFAVNGWPSFHFTSWRILMVSSVPAAFQEKPDASTGVGSDCFAKLYQYSGS